MKYLIWIGLAAARCIQAEQITVDLKAPAELEWLAVSRAKLTVAGLLAQAGVGVRWRERTAESGHVIEIRFLEASLPSLDLSALAYALPFAPGRSRITVLLRRLRPILPKKPEEAGAILGHVLAHELAHILKRSDGHSENGVMKARWDDQDFYKMTVGGLRFEDKDILAIRKAAVATRARSIVQTREP